ncbi:MAG TPA: hypothetical protein VIF62_03725 [Labilithrix sp.]|jgi:hypothetical protein
MNVRHAALAAAFVFVFACGAKPPDNPLGGPLNTGGVPDPSKTNTGNGPDTSKTNTGNGPDTSKTNAGSAPDVSKTNTGSGPGKTNFKNLPDAGK